MKITNFDDVFDYIGGFGPYQYIIVGFYCLCNCFYSFAYYGQIFMALTPPHRCKTTNLVEFTLEEKFNITLTEEEKLQLTIPLSADGLGFHKCAKYDVNFTEVNEWQIFNASYEWPVIGCDMGWEYNFTSYYPSITSQLNWVCSDDWKPPFAQTCFFLGSMFGVPLFGWLADRFGRLSVIVLTNIIGGAFGLASSFSSSFIGFCCLRFIVGATFDSELMIIYILGLEFVSAKYRSYVANVPVLLFLTLSACGMPWIAYYLHDWTLFGVVIHTPMLLIVLIIFISPESVRWLAAKGKSEKAICIIRQAAKINGRKLTDEFITKFKAYLDKPTEDQSAKVTCKDLLKTPRLRKRFILLCVMWAALFLAYDGHMRHSENIGYNFFTTFTIMMATELPADLITVFLMELIGRKYTVAGTLVFSGLLVMATLALEETAVWTIFAVATCGRFLITMSMNVGMQYIIEVLPTVGRSQGSAAIHALGFGVVLLSPYIIYLSKFRQWLPYLIIGLVSILGGLTSLLLPETMGEKLPDSLIDGEEFFKKQKLFGNPFAKEKHLKESERNAVPMYLRRQSSVM